MASRPAVLVTGASTGIGAACAVRLIHEGFRVFAGIRSAADGDRLREQAGTQLHPLPLDVTDGGMIARAVRVVEEIQGEHGLQGLVNNAGIAVGGPLEYLPVDDLRTQLEVNVIGLHAVTRACLPLIRRARGRVVHIGSISGRMAAPFSGAYAASKHAVEALCDALRLELAPEGISVSVIEPGQVRTPIWDKGLADFRRIVERMPDEGMRRYEGRLRVMHHILERARKYAAPAEVVADAVVHALTASEPKTRYLIGRDAKIRLWLSRLLPDRAMDSLVLRTLHRLERKVS
jgi:NAD(P)-dependent dehydrogenase (short-subunit alcohol dehydrogenase family)